MSLRRFIVQSSQKWRMVSSIQLRQNRSFLVIKSIEIEFVKTQLAGLLSREMNSILGDVMGSWDSKALMAAVNVWRKPLQWRHNEHDGVSNHQHHGWLLNRLYKCRSKKTWKLRVIGLCAGNSPRNGEFPCTKGQQRGKCFHLMTSSWMTIIGWWKRNFDVSKYVQSKHDNMVQIMAWRRIGMFIWNQTIPLEIPLDTSQPVFKQNCKRLIRQNLIVDE